MPFFKTIRWQAALLGILLSGIFLRSYWYFYNRSLWKDEAALANNIIDYDLNHLIFSALDNVQAAPPAYLAVVKTTAYFFGYGELSLRLFPFICSIISVIAFFLLSKQLFKMRGQLLANTLFCLSTPLIYYAAEAKQYQTELMASVIVLLLAVKYRYELSFTRAVLLGVMGAVLIWFSNTCIFSLAGIGLSLLYYYLKYKKYKSLSYLIGVGGIWVLSFAIYYFTILNTNSNIDLFVDRWQSKFVPLPNHIYWYIRTTVFSFNDPLGLSIPYSYTSTFPSIYSHLIFFAYTSLALLIVGIIAFIKESKYILTLLLWPVLITALASYFKYYPFHERFIVFLSPVVYLLIAKAADSQVQSGKGKKLVNTLVYISVVYMVVNVGIKLANPQLFGNNYKFSNGREAINFIDEHRQQNDIVYISIRSFKIYKYYNYRQQLNWKTFIGLAPKMFHNREELRQYLQTFTDQYDAHQKVYFLIDKTDDPLKKDQSAYCTEATFAEALTSYGRVYDLYTGKDMTIFLLDIQPKANGDDKKIQ